jgi:hypothetical protein
MFRIELSELCLKAIEQHTRRNRPPARERVNLLGWLQKLGQHGWVNRSNVVGHLVSNPDTSRKRDSHEGHHKQEP